MACFRLLLVDDHTLFRAGLKALLDQHGGFEVVAEASDGAEALRLVKEHAPDIVLMDLMMPGLNGLEATARIKKEHPDLPIVILSMNSAEEFVLPAIRAGASGFVLKSAAPSELAQAIKSAGSGESYLSPLASKHLVVAYRHHSEAPMCPTDALSPRQREVLQLVAEGNSTREIALRLGVSVKTVETYRAQLMETLDIHDIAGLTRFAIRHGVICPNR